MSSAPSAAIQPGTALPDGTIVQRPRAATASFADFDGVHGAAGPVQARLIGSDARGAVGAVLPLLEQLAGRPPRGTQRLVSMGEYRGQLYLVLERPDGSTLAELLKSNWRQSLSFRDIYNLLGHLSVAFEAIHEAGPHGALTPHSVRITSEGRLAVVDAFVIAACAESAGWAGAGIAELDWLAPEVRSDPHATTEAADFYALGVIAAVLMGETATADADTTVASIARRFGAPAGQLLHGLLAAEPSMRISTVAEFRDELRAALDGARAIGASGEPDQPVVQSAITAQLLAGLDLPEAPGNGPDDEVRWLVRRDGRDFGPYSGTRIREMLKADEIREETTIVDIATRTAAHLIDVPLFTDFVMDYLPQRAQRQIAQQERREEVVRTVKRSSTTFVFTGALALVAGAAALYYTAGSVEAFPFEDMVRDYPYVVPAPRPEYQSVTADDRVLAALFDFSDPAPPAPEPRRRRSGDSGAAAAEAGEEENLDDYVVSFDSSAPSSKLTDQQINDTLFAHRGSMQDCFEQELRQNPSFTGVSVSWSIRPDGRTFNVNVGDGGSTTLNTCLERTFRRMDFPQFNDVPMSVSLPFNLRR